jgi:hypothetical protein
MTGRRPLWIATGPVASDDGASEALRIAAKNGILR